MGTVNHTEVIFEQVASLGIRAQCGKAMMVAGEGMPPGLKEDGEESLVRSLNLATGYHGSSDGRIGYVFCPRFLVSVSEDLLAETAVEARRLGCRMQTHTSENPDENRVVEARAGVASLELLERAGFTGEDVLLVHAIHLSEAEMGILVGSGSHVVHCPSANAKLGSGTARIHEMLEAGVNVALGSDGAACNNNLSAMNEMRLAGHLQSLRLGPRSLPAERIVRMATRGGAKAMGLDAEIGSIETGKKADLVLLDPRRAHSAAPFADPYSRIVYGMDARNVAGVWVDGVRLVEQGEVLGLDEAAVVSEAKRETTRLLQRL
jgi:cytosine/adenosine deaminase-related metal-dependent hydrolase